MQDRNSHLNRGDFPANPPEKPGYRLEFNDDFDSPFLNTGNWYPYYLPHWSSRSQAAARFSISNGSLRLHIEEDQPPWCPEQDGGNRASVLQTGCFSGPVGSSVGQHHFKPGLVVSEAQPVVRLYTPRYGYFETRLKAVSIPGYMVALWMIGFEQTREESAEICICEFFGHETGSNSAQIGYGLHPFGDPTIREEFYKDTVAVDVSNFHLYAAQWTPACVEFYLDNVKIRTVLQSPSYPMQLMLSVYELPQFLKAGAAVLPWPKVFEVDYVRGYSPLAAG